jgi:hypothetical protein
MMVQGKTPCTVSLTKTNLMFGPLALLRWTPFGIVPRALDEISTILAIAGEDWIDFTSRYGKLKVLADALHRDDWTKAAVVFAHLRLPAQLDEKFAGRLKVAQEMWKANFNPAELRDVKGKWTRESSRDSSATITDIQYRGVFHDALTKDIINRINAAGGVAIPSVPIITVTGTLAIADAIVKPLGSAQPYILEVKTGNDPTFTFNQAIVYPWAVLGDHVTSFNPDVAKVGLSPGLLFPSLDVLVAYAPGPGQPIKYDVITSKNISRWLVKANTIEVTLIAGLGLVGSVVSFERPHGAID